MAGATLAAEVIHALNRTISSSGEKGKLTIQFGAYATFLSFFGLANLTEASADFFGIPEYGSTMTFELFTTTATDSISSNAPTKFPDMHQQNFPT